MNPPSTPNLSSHPPHEPPSPSPKLSAEQTNVQYHLSHQSNENNLLLPSHSMATPTPIPTPFTTLHRSPSFDKRLIDIQLATGEGELQSVNLMSSTERNSTWIIWCILIFLILLGITVSLVLYFVLYHQEVDSFSTTFYSQCLEQVGVVRTHLSWSSERIESFIGYHAVIDDTRVAAATSKRVNKNQTKFQKQKDSSQYITIMF
jgi:hypothetical protein